jgi:hypothetical protein
VCHGKANKKEKKGRLYLALNSGIMHDYNVDKSIKNIKIKITPKYSFITETLAKLDSDSDGDAQMIITKKKINENSHLATTIHVKNEVDKIMSDPFYKSKNVVDM